MNKLKIVFLGTPEISCGFLSRLADDGHDIAGVISRPDAQQGRGLKLCCPPVKDKARELCFRVFQPANDAELAAALSDLKPDLGVAVAYGRLLKKEVLSSARLGFLNVHFSLLPKYRGAAPVQRALMNGEAVTGVTVFWLDEGMDTGPVCASRGIPVLPSDDAPALFEKAAEAGRDLLAECLGKIAAGEIVRTPQSGEASRAPVITVADSFLDFSGPAAKAFNLVRGLACGPRARFEAVVNGRKTAVQVLRASLAASSSPAGKTAAAGTITAIEKGKGFFVKCGDSELLVEEVRPEGKKPMKAPDFLNGARLKPGDALRM